VAWTSEPGSTGFVRVWEGGEGAHRDYPATSEHFPVARTQDSVDYTAHVATMHGLLPNQFHCYEVHEDGEPVAGGLLLRTAFEDAVRPVRIMVAGDTGTGNEFQYALRDQMAQDDADLWLHLGDIAYKSADYVTLEQKFFRVYEDLLDHIPVYPVLGNHDYKLDGGEAYLDVFHLPENAARIQDSQRYYSFELGSVHFIALDSNPEALEPLALARSYDDQLSWLERDLASSSAPFTIAFFHHAPHATLKTSEIGHDPASEAVIDMILPLLEAGGVDLVLAGHEHHYERTHPLLNRELDPRGITYVISGAGGKVPKNMHPPPSYFTAARNDSVNSYLRLIVRGCTAVGESVDANGNPIDMFTVDACD